MSKFETQRERYVRLLGLGAPPTPVAQLTGSELLLTLLHVREQVRAIGLRPNDTITFNTKPTSLTVTGEQLLNRSAEVCMELDARLAPREDGAA